MKACMHLCKRVMYLERYSVDMHACVSRVQSVVSVTTPFVSSLAHILPLRHLKPSFSNLQGLPLTSPEPLPSLQSVSPVHPISQLMYSFTPTLERSISTSLSPHFQSQCRSFVGKISLHFKNPLKLAKI